MVLVSLCQRLGGRPGRHKLVPTRNQQKKCVCLWGGLSPAVLLALSRRREKEKVVLPDFLCDKACGLCVWVEHKLSWRLGGGELRNVWLGE